MNHCMKSNKGTNLRRDFVKRLDMKFALGVWFVVHIAPPGDKVIIVNLGCTIPNGGGGESSCY